jgi:hypothetical protein
MVVGTKVAATIAAARTQWTLAKKASMVAGRRALRERGTLHRVSASGRDHPPAAGSGATAAVGTRVDPTAEATARRRASSGGRFSVGDREETAHHAREAGGDVLGASFKIATAGLTGMCPVATARPELVTCATPLSDEDRHQRGVSELTVEHGS